MINTEVVSYDYLECGFSRFPDGSKFKYGNDGEICLATDCSTWAKRLINNLPLPDYIDSGALVPSETLSFPEFGTRERKKGKKESVGNYIEDCEFCGEYMEKTFRFYGKLVCKVCIVRLKEDEKCLTCTSINQYAELFTNDVEKTPFGQRYIKDDESDYCEDCSCRLKMVYKNDPILGAYYHSHLLITRGEEDDDYDRFFQIMIQEHCQVCGEESINSSICRDCRSWVFLN
jgi:hypothetical protein